MNPQPCPTLYDCLLDALRGAASHNPDDAAAPAAILWPDPESEWLPLAPRLCQDLPLLTLGAYDPAARSGPAIYLRALLSRRLEGADRPDASTPVVYLPGVAGYELRDLAACPPGLAPIAALQFSGTLFCRPGGHSWTVSGFLNLCARASVQVASDTATREALSRALSRLASMPLAELKLHEPLTAARIYSLLNPEPDRQILRWMSDAAGCRQSMGAEEWSGFASDCRQRYGFDPERGDAVAAAERLGRRDGPWQAVWNRYTEAARLYPGVQQALERAWPGHGNDLFYHAECWPQENEQQEQALCSELAALASQDIDSVRKAVRELEGNHAARRAWVWAELGRAPLAEVLKHLSALADATDEAMAGGTLAQLCDAYFAGGWRADAAFLACLRSGGGPGRARSVALAAEALYRPWLEQTTIRFQQAMLAESDAPSGPAPARVPESGVCLLFTDGLRLDVAHSLAEALGECGLAAEVGWRPGPLPGVTATAKPAISPAASRLAPGGALGADGPGGAPSNAQSLRALIQDAGYQILAGAEAGDPERAGWAECGQIDADGHQKGAGLARALPGLVREISDRASALLEAGWREVRIITDHGWLLLHTPLTKSPLPEHLTVQRKGRCARLKPESRAHVQTVPWFWDPSVRIAVAPGIGCFVEGKEYEHGGLSLQECVLPVVTVRAGAPRRRARIAEIAWARLRCRVHVEYAPAGSHLDLRTRASDPTSSVADAPAAIVGQSATLFAAADAHEGDAAAVALLAPDGELLAQRPTVIGGAA